MSALYGIILGIIQGITEFLPVSSFGHEIVFGDMLGMKQTGVLLESMLHLGTLAALFFMFRVDLVRIARELLGMLLEAVSNLQILIHNKRSAEQLCYHKLVNSTYRKLTAMLLVSCIPTAALGFTARRLVQMSALSPLVTGIGFFITGVFLIVTDFNKSGGDRTPRDSKYDQAMWIGIAQGISVFPGISRCALTVCVGLLCGFSRKYAVKYSFLVSIPAVIGAFLSQLHQFGAAEMTAGLGFSYVLGMLAAAVTGYLSVRFFISLLQKVKFRYFAAYCFLAGVVAFVWSIV